MDKLWAPWRVKYVTKIIGEIKGCVFCRMLKEKNDKKNFIVIRRPHTYAVLNIYPYNNGHMLIVPNRHVAEFHQLSKQERDELMDLMETTRLLLGKVLRPGGYNIGINIGKVAGAGFPDHLHIHLVPRWHGDVNFMPVTASTKVISQSLKTLYKKLADAYKRGH